MDAQSLMQMMLAAQQGGGGFDSASLLQQLASSTDDPNARLVATMLAQQKANAERAEQDDDDDDDDDDADERRAAELISRLERTQETLRRVYDELDVVRGRNQLLSEALGACGRCWGADPQCEICAGAGRPGSTQPNPALFSKFIVPALRTMSEARRRESSTQRPDHKEKTP